MGRINLVELLCENNADIKIQDNEGSLPLHKAAFNGHLQCIKFLLELKQPSLNISHKRSRTKSKKSKKGGDEPEPEKENGGVLTEESTEKGKAKQEFEVTDKSNNTTKDDASQATTLYINSKDHNGSTPLHKACYKGHLDCIKYLLENAANVYEKDDQGSTPLHNAVQSLSVDAVKLILEMMYPVSKGQGNLSPREDPEQDTNPKRERSDKEQQEPQKEELKERQAANTNDENSNRGVNELDNDLFSPLHIAGLHSMSPVRGSLETETHLLFFFSNILV